jgi:3-isopropylmalate/(R)-2-methylmalate dehydratase small subunit
MEPFRSLTSTAIPLGLHDVDTDQIIPAEYLKRIERSGFGEFLFSALRDDPDFVLNDERHADGAILLAGRNFGCGSSREHAPWAIEDYGIRAIIAPSFADIFRNNCVNVGIVAVVLDEAVVEELLARQRADHAAEITVDLVTNEVRWDDRVEPFTIDAFARERLLEGLDNVGLTLRHDADIAAFEAARGTA